MIDPAKFIVRCEEIPQSKEYPKVCVEFAEELGRQKPLSLAQAVEILQEKQQSMPPINPYAHRSEFFKNRPVAEESSAAAYSSNSVKDMKGPLITRLTPSGSIPSPKTSIRSRTSPAVNRYQKRQEPSFLKRFRRNDYDTSFDYKAHYLRDTDGETLNTHNGGQGINLKLGSVELDTKGNRLTISHPDMVDTLKFGHAKGEDYAHEHRWAAMSHKFSECLDERMTKDKREAAAVELY